MSCVSTEITLKSQQTKFVDTRLTKSKKEGLVYTDTRYTVSLKEEGQRASVCDLDNTKYSIISSLSDVYTIQKLLAGYNNLDIKELEKWEFIVRWGSLSQAEKFEKYEEFQGHELNVFLYFKDVDFFSQYVSSHIEHKSSKELVDYFLLGDSEKIKKLMTVQNLERLNPLEIALGVLLLKSSDSKNQELCGHYLKNLEEIFDVQKLIYDEKGPSFKQRFDTVLYAVARKEDVPNVTTNNSSTIHRLGARRIDDFSMRDRKMDAPKPYAANIKRRTSTCYMAEEESIPRAAMKKAAPKMRKRQLSNSSCGSDDEASICSESDHCSEDEDDDDVSRSRSMSQAYSTCMDIGGLNLMRDVGVLRGERADFNQLPESPRVAQNKDGKTIEYTERHSYFANLAFKRPFANSCNMFWIETIRAFIQDELDYTNLSHHFIFATNSIPEILAVLSIISLGFDSEEPEIAIEQVGNIKNLKIEAKTPIIVFCNETRETEQVTDGTEAAQNEIGNLSTDILVSQCFYDNNDKYRHLQNGQNILKKILTEFLPQRPYQSKITITNTLEVPLKIDLLAEIPQGSMPLNEFNSSKNWCIHIDAMSTQVKEFTFYFPETGKFDIFPATVIYEGQLVRCATVSLANDENFQGNSTFGVSNSGLNSGQKLLVTNQATGKKMETINDVLSQGNLQDITEFIKKANLYDPKTFEFGDILWLLKEKQFFIDVVRILRDRKIFKSQV